MKYTFNIKSTKIHIIAVQLLLASMVLFTSCSDFLDQKPEGRYIEDDYEGGSADGAIMGMYAKLRGGYVTGLPFVLIHSIRSDDADKGSSVGDGTPAEQMYDYFHYVASDNIIGQYWTGLYEIVILANNTLSDIETSGATDHATMVNRAEAKFMRAYAYFNLVRAFGDIPKIDFKVESSTDANIPKSPASEIYQLINSDLQEAATVLPIQWESKYLGRLTAGAAKALQARVFLTQENWSGAYSAATSVIHSNIYNLNTPYDKIFKDEGENSSESVFEIQAKYTQTEDYGVEYTQVQGVRGAGDWNLGWGWNTPSGNFVSNGFKDLNDPRKKATLLGAGETTEYGETVPAKTSDIPRDYWNKKVYTNPAKRREYNSNFGKWQNVRIIRYADVVLMAAEAANELGGEENIKEALGYLNMVRERAGGGSLVPPKNTTDQNVLRGYIRDERRAEFGMENERFYDLVRWGKGTITPDIDVTTFHALGSNYAGYAVKNRELPIPQAEIDKSKGVLVQNPNYQ